MIYQLSFTDKAIKNLEKLDKSRQEIILSALERIRINPHRYVRKMVGEPGYRLRVGDYRVLLEIHDDRLLIIVITVAHKRNAYDR